MGSKKRDEIALVNAGIEADRAVERALRAVVLRREGLSWGDIAERLGISQIEAQELARVAYARLGEAEAEHCPRRMRRAGKAAFSPRRFAWHVDGSRPLAA